MRGNREVKDHRGLSVFPSRLGGRVCGCQGQRGRERIDL